MFIYLFYLFIFFGGGDGGRPSITFSGKNGALRWSITVEETKA